MARNKHIPKARKIIATLITITFAVILGGVLHEYASNPPYKFLQDKHCILTIHGDGSFYNNRSATKYTYAFPEDFNTVCTMASKELLPMGFRVTKQVDVNNMQLCRFNLQGKSAQEFKEVMILGNQQAILHEKSGRAMNMYREGWSSVEVWHSRPRPRWLYFIDRMRLARMRWEYRRSARQR